MGAPWRGSVNADSELGMKLLCAVGRSSEVDDGKCTRAAKPNVGFISLAPDYVNGVSRRMGWTGSNSLVQRAKKLADVSVCGRGRGHPYRTACGRGFGGSNAQCFAEFPIRGEGSVLGPESKHPMYWRSDGSVHITSCQLVAWEAGETNYEKSLARATPEAKCTKWDACDSIFSIPIAPRNRNICGGENRV